MLTFESIQIVTNGEKFRIRVGKKSDTGIYFTHLPKRGLWMGCDLYGFQPMGELWEFDSREEAVELIKTEYGESGYRLLLESWNPC